MINMHVIGWLDVINLSHLVIELFTGSSCVSMGLMYDIMKSSFVTRNILIKSVAYLLCFCFTSHSDKIYKIYFFLWYVVDY